MLEEVLRSGFAEMGIAADGTAIGRFRGYYDALEAKNAVMNLTAIRGEDESARLHFLDSASPLLLGSLAGRRVIDVGTGAGFPGLPLKILEPEMQLTLLDSLGKRVDFLREVCTALSLPGVECVHGRAEEPGERRETYDAAVSRRGAAFRALRALPALCEARRRFLRAQGSRRGGGARGGWARRRHPRRARRAHF